MKEHTDMTRAISAVLATQGIEAYTVHMGGGCEALLVEVTDDMGRNLYIGDGDGSQPTAHAVSVAWMHSDGEDAAPDVIVAEWHGDTSRVLAMILEIVNRRLTHEYITLPSGCMIDAETWHDMRRAGTWHGWLDPRMYTDIDRDYMDRMIGTGDAS